MTRRHVLGHSAKKNIVGRHLTRIVADVVDVAVPKNARLIPPPAPNLAANDNTRMRSPDSEISRSPPNVHGLGRHLAGFISDILDVSPPEFSVVVVAPAPNAPVDKQRTGVRHPRLNCHYSANAVRLTSVRARQVPIITLLFRIKDTISAVAGRTACATGLGPIGR